MNRIDYSKIDVEEFLQDLGMRNIKVEGNEVMFSCPFPGHTHGDINPSASMQKGTTKTHCFGCGWSGNALTFVAEYENCSPLKASRFIRGWLGGSFIEPEGKFSEEIEKTLSVQVEKKIVRNQPIDKIELKKRRVDWESETSYFAQYLFDRGFIPSTLREWSIGWDTIDERISIPYFDNGDLIGFKGRALDEDVGPNHPRYKVIGGPEYGFDTFDVSALLFGKQKLRDWRAWFVIPRLIIREGELNVLALHQMQIGPTLGISGKFLSDAQVYIINKINEFNDSEIILYFDDENDAIKNADKLLKTHRVSIIPSSEKDPVDYLDNKQGVLDLLKNRFSAILP